MTDPTDIDPCPYCGTTTGVQPITDTSPRGPRMVVHGVRPELGDHHRQPETASPAYPADLGAAAQEIGRQRSILRQLMMLADERQR